MIDEERLKSLAGKIEQVRRLVGEIRAEGADMPAVERNSARILASVAMLEFNVNDVFGSRLP